MNKKILIQIFGVSTFSILIITGIYNLIDREYLEALGTFCLAISMFVFPQWYKKSQP